MNGGHSRRVECDRGREGGDGGGGVEEENNINDSIVSSYFQAGDCFLKTCLSVRYAFEHPRLQLRYVSV